MRWKKEYSYNYKVMTWIPVKRYYPHKSYRIYQDPGIYELSANGRILGKFKTLSQAKKSGARNINREFNQH